MRNWLLFSTLFIICFTDTVKAQDINQFSISTEMTEQFGNDYTLKDPDGNKVGDSSADGRRNIRVDANIPIWHNNTFGIAAEARYQYDYSGIKHSTVGNGKEDFHRINAGFTATLMGELLNRPTMFIGSFQTEFSQEGYERVFGAIGAIVMMKAQRNERLGIGVMVSLAKVSIFPIFPVIMWNKTLDDHWSIDCNAPRNFLLHYRLNSTQQLTMGAEMYNTVLYSFDANYDIPYKTYFDQKCVHLLIQYELNITKQVKLAVQGGGNVTFRGRIYDRDDIYDDPYYKYSQPVNFYTKAKVTYEF